MPVSVEARPASAKAMPVSFEARPVPAKAMPVSRPRRHSRAQATAVSDKRAAWSTGPDCGTRGRRRGLAGQRADAPSHTPAHQSPPVRRAPEGPEGPEGQAAVPTGGGGAWPGFEARGLAAVPVGGGRARAGLEIDHSEPQARVWRSRGRAAAHRHTQRPGPSRQATRRPEIYRGNEQREAARPHRDQAAHASGDSCQKPRIIQRSRWRRRGRLRR